MDLGLDGKVALVTGGIERHRSRDRAEARRRGLQHRHLRPRPRQARQRRGIAQIRPKAFAADLCAPQEVAALVDNVVKAFGGIDIVVSNAGTHLPGRLEEIDGDAMLEHFKTKVLGAWELARSRRAADAQASGGGRFIVIIGQAGKVPQANVIASTVINAAQHAFVKSLSDDLAPDGILVNAVCPSRIKKPAHRSPDALQRGLLRPQPGAAGSKWGAEVPLGHWGTPDDIANAVAFLASERAGFICRRQYRRRRWPPADRSSSGACHDRACVTSRRPSTSATKPSMRCATST